MNFFFENFSFFKKYFPLILFTIFFILFEFFNFFLKNSINFFYFFKLKLYFDFIVNFSCLLFKKLNFFLFFKVLDKGILEILGPNGFTRHCW